MYADDIILFASRVQAEPPTGKTLSDFLHPKGHKAPSQEYRMRAERISSAYSTRQPPLKGQSLATVTESKIHLPGQY